MPYTILAIETSGEQCSVALRVNGALLEQTEHGGQKASLHVLAMIYNLLSKSNTPFSKLNAIVFGQGPGTFTGVRLAASIAQSLAFAHDLPVVGISSLACLAQEAYLAFSERAIIAAVDARMESIYWGAYLVENDKMIKTVVPDTLHKSFKIPPVPPFLKGGKKEWIGVGNAWEIYAEPLKTQFAPYLRNCFPNCYPTARALIPLAIQKLEKGEILTPEQALPVYLRQAVS